MTVKHKCVGKIWGTYRDVSGRVYACSRNATVKRDGQWYCWQHDPERVKADKKRRQTDQEIKQKVLVDLWKRRARNARLAALANEKAAALLERLAEWARIVGEVFGVPEYQSAIDDAGQSRELAARIREALEAEHE